MLALQPSNRIKTALQALTDAEASSLLYDWRFWARANQLPPEGPWHTWAIIAGRGFGKTRTGSEWVREQVMRHGRRRIALVGRTSADCRKTMVEGEAGLLSVFPPSQRVAYEPSRRQVTFPNGAIAITYSSEEPDLLRGPAHDAAWVDELATFYDANKDDAGETGTTWSNLQMGLRLGSRPQQVVTTTPKPLRLLKQILADPGTVTTRGNTYENKANLAEAFYSKIISRYEGTRLGRQELHAEILEDIEGAIFQRDWFDTQRIAAIKPRDLQRIVVAIDPAVTSKDTSDDTGIVVAGLGTDGRGYLLDDATCKLSADGWMRRAIGLFHERKGDRIVAEVNNGGDMIEALLRTIDKDVPYKAVSASRGKITRAEPVAALVEQGKISHVGPFDFLEDELCQYTGKIPGEQSPNRLDAYVWAFTELMLEKQLAPRAFWV